MASHAAQATAKELMCVSCGRRIETEKDWVEFNCPQCGKEKILRCWRCKTLENQYECPNCNFTGP